METGKIEHPFYKNINEKEGDVQGWAFLNKDNFKKIYFSMPELKETEIRARMLYTGLCHSDSFHGRGLWGDVPYPVVTGHEGVGEVTEVGSKVTDHKKGDIVLFGCYRNNCHNCATCKRGKDNMCTEMEGGLRFIYNKYFGTYSTVMQIDQYWAFKAPKGLDLPNAAPLMCAGITTYAPLARFGKKGDHCLVIGIGGLGHMAVQYAAKMGMEVTAFVHNKGHEQFVKDLGATNVVDWTKEDLTKLKHSFDIAINCLPIMPTPSQLVAIVGTLKPDGHLIQVGVPAKGELFSLAPTDLVMNGISISGSLVGSKKETEDMLEFSIKHGVKVLCEHFSYDDMPQALDKLEHGKPKFRCVVDISKPTETH